MAPEFKMRLMSKELKITETPSERKDIFLSILSKNRKLKLKADVINRPPI